MDSKRKHVVLSIEEKKTIIERLNKGETASMLAREYNLGRSTITDIKKKAPQIITFMNDLLASDNHRKSMKPPKSTQLEDAVYLWFMQRRGKGAPVSGPLVCEKALILNGMLGGTPDFKATQGWLNRFKSRHGIRQLDIHGDISQLIHLQLKILKSSLQNSS